MSQNGIFLACQGSCVWPDIIVSGMAASGNKLWPGACPRCPPPERSGPRVKYQGTESEEEGDAGLGSSTKATMFISNFLFHFQQPNVLSNTRMSVLTSLCVQ